MIRVIKVSFVFTNYFQSYLCVNGVTFGKPLWMELVAGEPALIGGLQLSAPPDDLLGIERGWRVSSVTVCQVLNQRCLCNEASISPQKCRVWRASRLEDSWRSGKDVAPGEGMGTPLPAPHTLPCVSLLSGPYSFLL